MSIIYIIRNRVFSDDPGSEFFAGSDTDAIHYFQNNYEECTDDGCWTLSRKDQPLQILASTEPSDFEPEIVSYF